MTGFISNLCLMEIGESNGRSVYSLLKALKYSDKNNRMIMVPKGFQTDLASVPRLPIVYGIWGDRAHREAVLHDYLFRVDSDPVCSFMEANDLFLEAMESRGVRKMISYPMYAAVCAAGYSSFHRYTVNSQIIQTIDPERMKLV